MAKPNKIKKLFRTPVRVFFYLIGVIMTLIFACNIIMLLSVSDHMYKSVETLPTNQVGLVLGTSDKLSDGDTNHFFVQRIDIAATLYQNGKIKHVLVSGDNRTKYYNEPLKMKKALQAKGIPEGAITMDFAGLRTLDSIVRSKLVFGQTKLTVITQSFHAYRALFIGKKYNMDVVAIESAPLPFSKTIKVKIREIFARTVAFWDLYVLNTGPRHLGDQIEINTTTN